LGDQVIGIVGSGFLEYLERLGVFCCLGQTQPLIKEAGLMAVNTFRDFFKISACLFKFFFKVERNSSGKDRWIRDRAFRDKGFTAFFFSQERREEEGEKNEENYTKNYCDFFTPGVKNLSKPPLRYNEC